MVHYAIDNVTGSDFLHATNIAAVERGLTSKLDDARDAIVNKVVDLLGVYKTHILGSGSGSTPQLTVSDNLKLLPALTLGLLKHVSRYHTFLVNNM